MARTNTLLLILLLSTALVSGFFLAVSSAGSGKERIKMSGGGDEGQSLVERVKVAFDLHKRGQYEDAIKEYRHVLTMPDAASNNQLKSTINSNLGAVFMQLGQHESARETFEAALECNPDNSQVLFNLAVVLTSKLNEHRKALKHCSKALRLDSTNPKLLHLMGNIFQSMGRDADAEQYFVAAENLAIAGLHY
jgi:tetratricopeptide (TPR) repeat protein